MIRSEKIDRRDVYRRLGYPSDATPEAFISVKVDEIIDQLMAGAAPRTVKKEFSRTEIESLLVGKDIKRHLTDCSQCLLMAATLGSQTDTLLRKVSVTDMNEAVITDAVASVLIEGLAEEAERQARVEYSQKGCYVTNRFSPGYGDFPIKVQNELLHLLDAGRKIGLYATPTHILTPRKSITAVCGISTQPVKGSLAGCDTCHLKSTCQYRKEGKTCAT